MAFDQLSNSPDIRHISLARIAPVTGLISRNDDALQDQSQTSLLAGMMEMQRGRVKRLLEDGEDEKKVDGEDYESEFDAQSCANNHLEHHEKSKTDEGVEKRRIKMHRYAFETRSHVDILDDGYRWRKYGQKSVKNNNFPRSYYRCTHQGCNVKKQIQRLSKDQEVVITTYEGVHSHPIQKSMDNFEHILTQMQIYNTSPSL